MTAGPPGLPPAPGIRGPKGWGQACWSGCTEDVAVDTYSGGGGRGSSCKVFPAPLFAFNPSPPCIHAKVTNIPVPVGGKTKAPPSKPVTRSQAALSKEVDGHQEQYPSTPSSSKQTPRRRTTAGKWE